MCSDTLHYVPITSEVLSMNDMSMSDLFRNALGQSTEQPVEESKPKQSFNHMDILRPKRKEYPVVRRNAPGDLYQAFLDKYDDLERFIDGFTEQDLTYYFREKAKEAGYKYHIANMKRDRGIFKKLLGTYSPVEIALMIEFIFFSEQDYLDAACTQPTVLASNFVNRIYRDSKLWVEDKYVPGKKSKFKLSEKREWKNSKPDEERVKIGEW